MMQGLKELKLFKGFPVVIVQYIPPNPILIIEAPIFPESPIPLN